MNENWGPGVTRTLSALARSFTAVVWQDGKNPTDAELNLMSQIDWENLADTVRAQVHSGFFLDPTRCQEDITTHPLWSNQFVVAPVASADGVHEATPTLMACVNGWVFPVAGTDQSTGSPDDVSNRIRLNPPPTTETRTDFVFLEVWRALVSVNPSTVNKPSAAYIWKYGNVQYGGTNVPDDLLDPRYQFETTKRVQLQYRIRVVGAGDSLGTSVDLTTYPDGLTDPQVRAQGTATAATTFAFTNMRQELGDPSLWRAGDGNPSNTLGTTDGYVYAIPMMAVFRRNATDFTSLSFSGSSNQNGAIDRTPSTRLLPTPRSGARALTQATLAAPLAAGTIGSVVLSGLVGSGLDDTALFPSLGVPRFLVVGEGIDQEIISITSVSTGGSSIFIDPSGRGRGGSAEFSVGRWHPAGTPVSLYNTNPRGLYADQVDASDILDLRRSISFGGWDYNQLLQHAVAGITQGSLRTVAKGSGSGGNTRGTVTTEVSYLHSPQAMPITPPTGVDPVDGPDGIRTVWSDSVAIQRDVSVILDPAAPISNGIVNSYDTNLSLNWAPSADWQPHGFLNIAGGATGWTNGSVVFLHIGGVDGQGGARYGLQGSQKAVRFVAPSEAWIPGGGPEQGDQHPWKLRFIGGASGNTYTPSSAANNGFIAARITNPPAPGETTEAHPGPMYPVPETNFERPFIVLGDILNPAFVFTGIAASSTNFVSPSTIPFNQIRITGQNWNTLDQNAFPLGREGKTLRDLLTNDGRDTTGFSSQIYIVVYGDTDSRDNNGAFRVIGAGTVAAQGNNPYTQYSGTTVDALVVLPLSADFQTFFNSSKTVVIEMRSQEILAELDDGKTNPAGVAVVMTDLQATNPGGYPLPWSQASPSLWDDGTRLVPIASKAILDTDIMWSPSRGASSRVPDHLVRFGAISSDSTVLRSVVSAVDPSFVTDGPFPSGERFYESNHIQVWNRLPSRGHYQAGDALSMSRMWGGGVVGSSEQSRESELFVDLGSKTAIFRPFTQKNMTLKGVTTTASPSLVGVTTYSAGVPAGQPIDGAGIFTSSLLLGYQVPLEYMPRFGRQDIPYHTSTGALDPILPGINHLFSDTATVSATATVFWIVGGENNATSGNLVTPMLFTTNSTTVGYCRRGTISGGLHPAYGARRQFYGDVISSDLGVGMHGIELPPYHGIARVYGVYEYNDFISHLSGTFPGAFQGDRLTPISDPPRNLLKVGATKQTLFIREGGGQDVTGSAKSHTYLVPEEALDITNIPGYTTGQTFTDYHYVVECTIFGFAQGFISENNLVLARRKTGQGGAVTEGANPELAQVTMILPSPAAKGDGLYEVYDRTVYQGDPYLTRGGSVAQPSDYVARYGQVNQADAFNLTSTIQQFDPITGNMIVTRPNPRALQVLASMDFYTTLGTGKVGGRMWPGTPVDCGYTSSADSKVPRIPGSADTLPWRVLPRAFTAGQVNNSTYASIEIVIRDYDVAIEYHLTVEITTPNGTTFTFTAPADFGGGGSPSTTNEALAEALATAINNQARSYLFAQAAEGVVLLVSAVPGALGNQFRVALSVRPNISPAASGPLDTPLPQIASVLRADESEIRPPPSLNRGGVTTGGYFSGGVDSPVNAGNGDSVVSLTGMTERLPLGILVSDSDFMGEDILNNRSSSLQSSMSGVGTVYEDLPLTRNGQEYTRFVADPGSVLALSDGGVLRYLPYTSGTPSGSTAFRLYRGGGAVMVISGAAPGGPVSWLSESFAAALQPVLKGAALACKAILVRNFPERAFAGNVVRSEGDEIQVIILTYAVYGTPFSTQYGVALLGVISPTGYGEGYAAADRYLIQGRPMDRGRSRVSPAPGLQPAPFFYPE